MLNKEKLKNKITNKTVGVLSVRNTCENDPIAPTQKNKGITLIALIITIIVMLILVGVTINVALNGGLFTSARKGTYQTQASIIKEQLEVEKATMVANNNGDEPSDYGIGTIENLDISQDLKDKFGSKLTISAKGTLYYTDVVTDNQEQSWLEEIGIEGEPTQLTSYTFTIGELLSKEGVYEEDYMYFVPVANFWPVDTPEELKNSYVFINSNQYEGYYNASCSDDRFVNIVESDVSNTPFQYAIGIDLNNNNIAFIAYDETGSDALNYIEYSDVSFTISIQ